MAKRAAILLTLEDDALRANKCKVKAGSTLRPNADSGYERAHYELSMTLTFVPNQTIIRKYMNIFTQFGFIK
jgi:hypothetical protein